MKKTLRTIDLVNEYVGEILSWLCFALVLLVVYDVIMRYVFGDPTGWGFETAIMTGGTIFALSWAYTLRYHGHVKVDVLYSHLSPRLKAVIDIIGYLFLFLPFLIVLTNESFSWMWEAWLTGEKSIQTSWYPPLAPFRTIVLMGFSLLIFQTVAQLVRDFYLAIRGRVYD